MKHRHRSLN